MKKLKFFVFKLQNKLYGLPSTRVKEILETRDKLKPMVYNRGGGLEGLLDHEGSMLSVLNTNVLLDNDAAEAGKMILIVTDRGMERPVGLIVDGVEGIRSIDETSIKYSHDKDISYIKGFVKEGEGGKEEVITILDLANFFQMSKEKLDSLDNKGRGVSNA